MLVAGSVIIGRREEAEKVGAPGTSGNGPDAGVHENFSDEPDAPLAGADGRSSKTGEHFKDSIELEVEPSRKNSRAANE
jgi:hypothetical protein